MENLHKSLNGRKERNHSNQNEREIFIIFPKQVKIQNPSFCYSGVVAGRLWLPVCQHFCFVMCFGHCCFQPGCKPPTMTWRTHWAPARQANVEIACFYISHGCSVPGWPPWMTFASPFVCSGPSSYKQLALSCSIQPLNLQHTNLSLGNRGFRKHEA